MLDLVAAVDAVVTPIVRDPLNLVWDTADVDAIVEIAVDLAELALEVVLSYQDQVDLALEIIFGLLPLISGLIDTAGGLTGTAAELASELLNDVLNAVGPAIDTATRLLNDAIPTVLNAVDDASGDLVGQVSDAAELAGDVADGLVPLISSLPATAIAGAVAVINLASSITPAEVDDVLFTARGCIQKVGWPISLTSASASECTVPQPPDPDDPLPNADNYVACDFEIYSYFDGFQDTSTGRIYGEVYSRADVLCDHPLTRVEATINVHRDGSPDPYDSDSKTCDQIRDGSPCYGTNAFMYTYCFDCFGLWHNTATWELTTQVSEYFVGSTQDNVGVVCRSDDYLMARSAECFAASPVRLVA